MRGQHGVQLLDGIDTLLVQLLVQLGDAAQLSAFAAGRSRAAVEQVAGPLRDARRFHALALLHAARGEPEQALELWRVSCHRRQDVSTPCCDRTPAEANAEASFRS